MYQFVIDPKAPDFLQSLASEALPYFKNYFQKKYSPWQILSYEFFEKPSGRSVGTILSLIYHDPLSGEFGPRRINFYIKVTHPFDNPVGDWLFYKILEHSGAGPKVHFFSMLCKGKRIFLIATQDIQFTKHVNTVKNVEQDAIASCTDGKANGPAETHNQRAVLELLSNILGLTDLVVCNYGYVRTTRADFSPYYKLKIFDFDYPKHFGGEADYEVSMRCRGIESAFGKEVTQFALQQLQSGRFISRDGKECYKSSLAAAILRAYTDIENYAISHQNFLDVQSVKQDLEKFKSTLFNNYNLFRRHLNAGDYL